VLVLHPLILTDQALTLQEQLEKLLATFFLIKRKVLGIFKQFAKSFKVKYWQLIL